jgi:hypothetical protein
MARRRYQDPTPKRRGLWWTLRFRRDEIIDGKLKRIRKEVRLALVASTSERDARRLAAEHLRPLNQGLESIGAPVNFQNYVEKHFIPLVMPQYLDSMYRAFTCVERDRSDARSDHHALPVAEDMERILRYEERMHRPARLGNSKTPRSSGEKKECAGCFCRTFARTAENAKRSH